MTFYLLLCDKRFYDPEARKSHTLPYLTVVQQHYENGLFWTLDDRLYCTYIDDFDLRQITPLEALARGEA